MECVGALVEWRRTETGGVTKRIFRTCYRGFRGASIEVFVFPVISVLTGRRLYAYIVGYSVVARRPARFLRRFETTVRREGTMLGDEALLSSMCRFLLRARRSKKDATCLRYVSNPRMYSSQAGSASLGQISPTGWWMRAPMSQSSTA